MPHYVLEPEVIESCLWAVATRPTHRHFPGYLGVKRTARIEDQSSGLDFDYTGFYDAFLRVRDDDDPYLTPFGPDTDPDRHSLWFNRNVAGTYAPSSIRPDQPFSRAVTVEGSGHDATYALVDDHYERAREELLSGQRLPVAPLACFLYRDFAVETDDEPAIEDFVAAFREEFGYRDDVPDESAEFEHLYERGDIDAEDPFVEVGK